MGLSGEVALPKDMLAEAQWLAKGLRNTTSQYGELKHWGPLGLNQDNFAGIAIPSWEDGSYINSALRAAKRKGLQSHVYDQPEELKEVIQQMQGGTP